MTPEAAGYLAKAREHPTKAFTRFLARTYQIEEIADYGIDPSAALSAAEAQRMIDAAAGFVDRIAEILA